MHGGARERDKGVDKVNVNSSADSASSPTADGSCNAAHIRKVRIVTITIKVNRKAPPVPSMPRTENKKN